MPEWEDKVTIREAYLAMFEFLRRHYERGGTEEVASLLGGLSILPDGASADPALTVDYLDSVSAVLDGSADDPSFRLR